MAINEKLIVQEAAAPATDADPNIMLDLNAGDVDSYDGDGDVWYDIHDFEFKPTTNVSEHFNTVTWSGDGASTRSITGVGFQPDLVWVKARQAQNHTIYDSVRGTGKYLASDGNTAETTSTTYGQLTSFDSDGFTGSEGSNQTYSFFNSSSQTYVAWCFNAGDNEVSNTEGTIDSTVRANNDLGFSIAKYIGNGSSTGATVGHGLDTPPEMIIVKDLDDASDWAVYSSVTGNTKKLLLNSRNGAAASGVWNNTSPTSSVFNVRYSQTNELNNDFIAYSFTSKRGVSKVGSYIGNGTTNNKIYTGFEPAFFMLKNTSLDNTGWLIKDNVRGENSKTLLANSNAAEYDTTAYWTCDFERDGVRLTYGADNEFNRNGDTYIFYAVAKDTNETSLIPDTDLELNLEADSYSGSGDWLDSSGNGNDGTITGATWEQELGNFFDLDGSGDYIDAPTSGVLSGDFTVEMWWNFDSLSDGYRMLLGSSGYQVGSGLGHYIENSRLRTWVSVSGSTSNVLNGSGTDLTTNKWQHVVLTRSGGTYTQYIDTNQVGQASGTTASLDGTNSRIGGHYTQNGHDINAKVGQVRLYSTALSQAQIRQNFNFTKPKYPNEFHGDLINMDSSNWNASGYFDFNGSNEYIQTELKTRSSEVSYSFWYNADTLYSTAFLLHLCNKGGRIDIATGTSTNDTPTSSNEYVYLNASTGTSWTHATLVAEGWGTYTSGSYGSAITVKVYLNGVLEGTVNPTPYGQDTGARIARSGGGHYFNGQISKVKAYNKALTQEEITALYNEGE